MPTLTATPDTKYKLPEKVLIYLANDVMLLGGFPHLIGDHVDPKLRRVFQCQRDLYFTEDELCRKTGSIAVFMLNPEDFDVARYVVVGTIDVRVGIDGFSKITMRELKPMVKRPQQT